jgi:hypothetical protein
MRPDRPEFVSHEKGAETLNQSAHQVRHLFERFNDRLRLDNLRLADRYIKSESGFHFLIDFSLGLGHEKFVAYFERAHIVDGNERQLHFSKNCFEHTEFRKIGNRSQHMGNNIDVSEQSTRREDHTMLVDVVHCVEAPEGVTLISVPSSVWFDVIDEVDRILLKSLYFSQRLGFVFRGTIEDGKINVRADTSSLTAGGKTEQLKGKVVQSAPEILNYIADDQRDNKWNRSDADYIIDQLSRLRIALGINWIWLGRKEGAHLDIQVTDVLFGPFDFRLD